MSKLIKFETRAEFESFVKTNSGLDNLDEALTSENNGVYGKIALIVDTNEIYVKEQIFNTGTGGGESTVVEYALKSEVQELDETKQDIIFDLSTIRQGAAKGATALQSIPEEYVTDGELATVATSGSYNDLSDKPTIPSVPTKVSDFENDAQYITEQTAQQIYQPKGDYALKSELEDNVAYPLENHTETTLEIAPNVMHVWGEMTALTVTLGTEESGKVNEYVFQFTSGTTATTLSLPSTIVWANGEALTPEANKTYQVSIVNSFAIYTVF